MTAPHLLVDVGL